MKKALSLLIIFLMTLCLFVIPITAANIESVQALAVSGRVYSFDDASNYDFSTSTVFENTETADTYGSFQIKGITAQLNNNGTNNGVPSFTVENGNIEISYTYSDRLLLAPEEELHLVSDGGNKVDALKLDEDIKKGALILQRSLDHKNWNNIVIQTNAFENTPNQKDAVYTTKDVELINGCYYRLIVAYKTEMKEASQKILGLVSKNTFIYQRHAEVYEFYAALENEYIESLEPNIKRFNLGETVKVADGDSYSGEKQIESNDLHYGWDLGQFFVSGYTSNTTTENGDVVFLKNVGDVVTLWFNLKQNIDALNGDKDVSIAFDEEGSDQYFQTKRTKFGRGMLIVRKTDHENVKHEPVMYYDYLEANTSFEADTRVQLFEEGDYEVALDYEIKKDGFAFLGSSGHYRIFFKFSVRNANCMVYPFDTKTGAELTNSAFTENGFYLDLAKSRYLTIFIKKEVWTEGADGLTQDTRFNTIAKDGDRYTDEGIYTITAKNQYTTGPETTKRIYVGKNPILKAYVKSKYSIQELVQLVDAGAIIYEDGTIEMPANEPTPEPEASVAPEMPPEQESAVETTAAPANTAEAQEETEPAPTDNNGFLAGASLSIGSIGLLVGAVAIALIIGLCVGLALKKRRSREDIK